MRKILSALLIFSMATPAFAHERGYYDTYGHRWVEPRYEHSYPRYERRYERRREGGGDVVVPILGGIILGAILTSQTQKDRDPKDYRYDTNCDCYHR